MESRPFNLMGDVNCHGDPKVVKEGCKSFPGGHTSWSFASLAFLSWYLCGKVKAFDRRGHAAKLYIVLLPLLFAALVEIPRINDYWHHWTDEVWLPLYATCFSFHSLMISTGVHLMHLSKREKILKCTLHQ